MYENIVQKDMNKFKVSQKATQYNKSVLRGMASKEKQHWCLKIIIEKCLEYTF